jgi:hypothetical protein
VKQILRPQNWPIWRSIAILTAAGLIVAVDNRFVPTSPAGADSFTYSGVDRHCISPIDRSVTISLQDAAALEALPAFTVTNDAGLAGLPIYCQLAQKAIQTPNGVMWGTPSVLPIAEESSVLVITVMSWPEFSRPSAGM